MNKIASFLLVIIASVSLTLVATKQGKAQEKSFSGVVPFVTSNDRVGFLDQGTGRVYVYDNNLSQCLFVGQIDSLGKPIQALSSNTPSPVTQ